MIFVNHSIKIRYNNTNTNLLLRGEGQNTSKVIPDILSIHITHFLLNLDSNNMNK